MRGEGAVLPKALSAGVRANTHYFRGKMARILSGNLASGASVGAYATDVMMQLERGVGECKVCGAAGRGDVDAENWVC